MLYPIALLITSNYYWMLLILTSFIVALTGIVFFIIRSKQAANLLRELGQVDRELADLDDASAENAEQVLRLLQKTGIEGLPDEFRRLMQQSKEVYKGEYFADPRSLVIAIQQSPVYLKLKSPTGQIAALIGLVLTVLLIAFQNFFTGSNALMLSSSAFPFLLGLLLMYLTLSVTQADQQSIDYQAERVYERIKMAIPVYDPEAASRLLIERFVSYNESLSQSARELVADEVVSGVSDNLNKILQKDLVPSLQASSERLNQLAERIEQKQDSGMRELAETFSTELTQKLIEQFGPMSEQIAGYAALMADSHKHAEASMELFDQHRESLGSTAAVIEESIKELRAERSAWHDEQQALNKGVEEFTASTTALNALQMSSMAEFAEQFEKMSLHLNRFAELNRDAQDKLVDLTSSFDTLVRDNLVENKQAVQDYRLLSSEIKSAAKHMELSNLELTTQLSRLSESLDESIGKFTTQIQHQVDGTLSDFDKGLAEMSLRLAHSATEMRDTANVIARQTGDLKARAARNPEYAADVVGSRDTAAQPMKQSE